MKKICAGCNTEKFIISGDLCSGCFMAKKFNVPKANSSADATELREPKLTLPTVNVTVEVDEDDALLGLMAETKPVFKRFKCDICEKEFSKADDLKVLMTRGKRLLLCDADFKAENEAIAAEKPKVQYEYQTWPKCAKCGAHVKDLPEGGFCKNCSPKAKEKVDLVAMSNVTDSNKYQQFFNQTTEEIKDMTVEQVRDFIIASQAEIFSLEAELLRAKTKKQAAQIKFNAILEKMSLEDRDRLKIQDSNYVVKDTSAGRKLKSPLEQATKKKKVKEDMSTKLTALFGDKLSADEIAERLKKLGL